MSQGVDSQEDVHREPPALHQRAGLFSVLLGGSQCAHENRNSQLAHQGPQLGSQLGQKWVMLIQFLIHNTLSFIPHPLNKRRSRVDTVPGTRGYKMNKALNTDLGNAYQAPSPEMWSPGLSPVTLEEVTLDVAQGRNHTAHICVF